MPDWREQPWPIGTTVVPNWRDNRAQLTEQPCQIGGTGATGGEMEEMAGGGGELFNGRLH